MLISAEVRCYSIVNIYLTWHPKRFPSRIFFEAVWSWKLRIDRGSCRRSPPTSTSPPSSISPPAIAYSICRHYRYSRPLPPSLPPAGVYVGKTNLYLKYTLNQLKFLLRASDQVFKCVLYRLWSWLLIGCFFSHTLFLFFSILMF